MQFGGKLCAQRGKRGLTQEELGKALGISIRTVKNYENGNSHPKDRGVYFKLAEFFGVDVNYFLTEDEEFLTKAAELHGKKGREQAQALLDQAAVLFAGGELSDADQLAFVHNMQALYLESKGMAKAKFTPKKYRKAKSENGGNGDGG